MSQMEIDRVLAQIRSIRAEAGGRVGGAVETPGGAAGASSAVIFAAVLRNGLDSVNAAQQTAISNCAFISNPAAGDARDAEGQRLVPRGSRGAQQARRRLPGNHEHAGVMR